jgi:hypothetical protein
MSLLLERMGSAAPLPRLDGREKLVGTDPAVCKVKGVMFAGRKHFLSEIATPDELSAILQKVSAKTRPHVKTPLASAWVDFESLIDLDRTIYETLEDRYPNILALIGAASAELGIGKLYKSLDSEELTKFLADMALFHDQYQKFGRVRFEKTSGGGRMIHTDYPCYSPIYCASGIGYFLESMLRHGAREPNVVESRCQCRGDKSCTYEMTWS